MGWGRRDLPQRPALVSGCPQQRLLPFVSYKPLEKLLEEVWVLRLSLQTEESILLSFFSTSRPFMWSLSLESVPQAWCGAGRVSWVALAAEPTPRSAR